MVATLSPWSTYNLLGQGGFVFDLSNKNVYESLHFPGSRNISFPSNLHWSPSPNTVAQYLQSDIVLSTALSDENATILFFPGTEDIIQFPTLLECLNCFKHPKLYCSELSFTQFTAYYPFITNPSVTFAAHEIVPGLFLGSSPEDSPDLFHYGFTHILNCADDTSYYQPPGTVVLHLNLNDNFTDVLHLDVGSEFIDAALDFHPEVALKSFESSDDAEITMPSLMHIMEQHVRQRGVRVLVHCYMGRSRSATHVAAYLMRTFHLRASPVLRLLHRIRNVSGPNDGFIEQLYEYESVLKERWAAATRPHTEPEVEFKAETSTPRSASEISDIARAFCPSIDPHPRTEVTTLTREYTVLPDDQMHKPKHIEEAPETVSKECEKSVIVEGSPQEYSSLPELSSPPISSSRQQSLHPLHICSEDFSDLFTHFYSSALAPKDPPTFFLSDINLRLLFRDISPLPCVPVSWMNDSRFNDEETSLAPIPSITPDLQRPTITVHSLTLSVGTQTKPVSLLRTFTNRLTSHS